jgi:Cu+-exporting ATPase
VARARAENLKLKDVTGFASRTGLGIQAELDGMRIAVGNSALMSEMSVDISKFGSEADSLRDDGQTVIWVAIDGKAAGFLGVSDPVKDGAAAAIRGLHDAGVKVVMVTGDNAKTARAVAGKIGVDRFYADVLPQGKADVVKAMQQEGRFVAMAGDGINDAPALAQAQVGIAMGTGTDVAMNTAGVTLVKGDLAGILRARALSEGTLRNIKQNLFFAFIYNLLGVPVAAGVLYPFFGLLLNPMIAAAAMSFSSVSVIGNALRLKRVRL